MFYYRCFSLLACPFLPPVLRDRLSQCHGCRLVQFFYKFFVEKAKREARAEAKLGKKKKVVGYWRRV